MYKLVIRPLLFLFPAEAVHHFSFKALRFLHGLPGMPGFFKFIWGFEDNRLQQDLFGLTFKNPVGLAAGFDKDAKLIDELATMGFGFIEIGTVTPKGQDGNEKPRLFRLPPDGAVINRMGFNNDGMDAAVLRLQARKSNVIVGGNIGKNKITPNEEAFEDYKKCFNALYDYVDYFVVNVSSPNTPNLRELQEKEPLTKLLTELMVINKAKPKAKPILLKIAPDLSNEQLDDIIQIVRDSKIAGIIATNTTVQRDNLNTDWKKINNIGAGGLSGKPLTKRSTEVIQYIFVKSKGEIPIIGVGGITTAKEAIEKINAGASLVQVYTGFIYEGPSLIKKINKAILKVNG